MKDKRNEILKNAACPTKQVTLHYRTKSIRNSKKCCCFSTVLSKPVTYSWGFCDDFSRNNSINIAQSQSYDRDLGGRAKISTSLPSCRSQN